ncbi:hypothetical protein HYH03_017703 [Edaphochlamys debaryana]|uniref:Uncharacterized protein n=1 Tax=Edaphochlamys debaryana TaxID=47281 RepID=A0A835XHD9_9CHLO|nr:hypothetical protein HYH03_017703 [Edaphochlamys debaryana]|eukprot:KAG2483449.1 hypothetical protein HYH03_017703 [Edaphochlamys debaryana]
MRPTLGKPTSAFVGALEAPKSTAPMAVPAAGAVAGPRAPAGIMTLFERRRSLDWEILDEDDDCQFAVDLDDQRSSLKRSSYSRAVHIAHPEPATELERKVQKLVADWRADSTAAIADVAPAAHVAALAQHLRVSGFEAIVTAAPKPLGRTPLTTRSINVPYLVVIEQDAAGRMTDTRQQEAVIVDPALRDHLAVAPATPAFQRSLAAAVPEGPFVASRDRLARLVASLAPALEANFASQGMDLPPWRRTAALMHRWSGVDAQLQRLRVRHLDQLEAAQALASATETASPFSSVSVASDSEHESWADDESVYSDIDSATPSRASSSGGAAGKVVPVFGFEVGSTAVGREPWRGVQPGAFSRALAAVAASRDVPLAVSDAGSSDSSVDSEADLIAGLSPVSVFRASPPRAVPVK